MSPSLAVFLVRLTVLILAAGCSPNLAAETLVDLESTWRWRPGLTEASIPINAWRTVAFNDLEFTNAPAPFSYWDPFTNGTHIVGMQNAYGSLFLRKAFVIRRAADVIQLRMEAQVDDGFVAWINGAEVQRVNMPDGPGTAVTIASRANSVTEPPAFVVFTLTNPAAYLTDGTNLLAVQVFQDTVASPDLRFDASLHSIEEDSTPPTLTATDPGPDTITLRLDRVKVSFSKPVTGVEAGDLLINGRPADRVNTNAPSSYEFVTSRPPAQGRVQVTFAANHGIMDLAGRPFAGAEWTCTRGPGVIISEFMAANDSTIRDDDGEFTDWIEIHNLNDQVVDLEGCFLTDDLVDRVKWRFPQTLLGPRGYLLVFASGKNRAVSGRQLHTNFKLDAAGEYLGLVWTNFVPVSEFAPYLAQAKDDSYGVDRFEPELLGYFADPTPGAPNSTTGTNATPVPSFSLESGVYTNDALVVVISYPAGTSVRYTTDGSEPLSGSPLYAVPLQISGSATIKARAFQEGRWPSAIVARSFVLLDATTRGFNSNLPIIVLTTPGPIPFNVVSGGARRRGSVAVFDLDKGCGRSLLAGPPEFVGLAQYERFGGTAANFPKSPYTIEINDELGDDRAVPLLGMPAEADWKLRNPYSDKCLMNDFLALEMFEQMGHYSCRRRLVEVFVDTTGTKLNYTTSYQGVYVLLERIEAGPNRVNIPELTPYDITEPAVTGGYIFKRDRTSVGDLSFSTPRLGAFIMHEPKTQELANTNHPQVVWLQRYVNQLGSSLYATNWLARTGTNHYANYLDVDSLVDYHWMVEFTKQVDGYRASNFFTKDRGGKVKNAPIWDWNLSFGNANYLEGGRTNGWYYPLISENEHGFLRRLVGTNDSTGDPDFKQKIVDRWSVLRTNVMNGDRLVERIDELAAMLSEAATRDFARFPRLAPRIAPGETVPGYVWPNPNGPIGGWHVDYVNPTSYAGIISQMKQWTRSRFLWVDSQFLRAPTFSVPGGLFPSGTNLTLHSPYPVFYTLDGTDPRLPGGDPAPGAQLYSGPISITLNARVFARARTSTPGSQGTPWSGPTVGLFVVTVPKLVVTELMYHPDAGPTSIPDEQFEFIELKNTGNTPLDLQGYRWSGALEYRFSFAVLLPGQFGVIVPNLAAFQLRYGTGPLILGTYSTWLPNGGGRLALEGPVGEPIFDFTYRDDWYPETDGAGRSLIIANPLGPSSAWSTGTGWCQSTNVYGNPGRADPACQWEVPTLAITEVMYAPHPAPADSPFSTEDFEYVEVMNYGPSAITLANCELRGGIGFKFPDHVLAPRECALVAKNIGAATSRYGTGRIIGEYGGTLNNDGDEIVLTGDGDRVLQRVIYRSSWFPIAGSGLALTTRALNPPPSEINQKDQWVPGFSPGVTNPPPILRPVVINEVLSHPEPPYEDAIELYNPAPIPADLSGWFLSDNFDVPTKYRIPLGTVIPPGEFIALDEHTFNPEGAPSPFGRFAFNALGDDIYLFSADTNGVMTGYFHGFPFGAAEPNVSFGRHVTSTGEERFVPQIEMTLARSNSGPRVGPLVLTEIHFFPPQTLLDGAYCNNTADEYLEFRNISSEALALFNAQAPAGTWRLRGAVDFDFPTNLTIPPGGFIIVCSIDPADPGATAQFRDHNGIRDNVLILGPWIGALDNDGETITLTRPIPINEVVAQVVVERVTYPNELAPDGIMGAGGSLNRIDDHAFADDPVNWRGAGKSPGRSNLGGRLPTVVEGLRDTLALVGGDITFRIVVESATPLTYVWRSPRGPVLGVVGDTLSLHELRPDDAGPYTVTVLNDGGAVTHLAELTLLLGPQIGQQPTNVAVRIPPDPAAAPRTNAQFQIVVTTDHPPLTYQWRFNGATIPGATNASLVISNVTLAEEGDYSCALTDAFGTIPSHSARLSPLITPTFLFSPSDQRIAIGSTATVGAVLSGNPLPFTFEWRRGGTVLASNTVFKRTDFWTFTAPTSLVTDQVHRVVVKSLAASVPGIAFTFHLTTLADTDGDGLPDEYEDLQGLNRLDATDGQIDSDGDGMANNAEYIAGTDPRDAASFLRIEGPSVANTNAGTEVSFLANSNRTYAVQARDSLAPAPWQTITDVAATRTNRWVTVIDPDVTGAGVSSTPPRKLRVYRLLTPKQ